MSKIFFIFILILPMVSIPSRPIIYVAEAKELLKPIPQKIEIIEVKDDETPVFLQTRDSLKLKVKEYGEKWNLTSEMQDRMFKTIANCENRQLDPKLQSNIKDPTGPNGRENSWGIAQINLYYNPDVTRAEAQDLDFSLNWMAKEWSEGKQARWSCYRHLYH